MFVPQKYELGNDKFVSISNFRETLYVHIRVHDKIWGYPTSVGISLKPSRFAILSTIASEVSEKLEDLKKPEHFEYKVHLGGGLYCVVQSRCFAVNLRRYFVPIDKMCPIPTKKGITLTPSEWKKLIAHMETLKTQYPELNNAVPCGFSESHNNQESAFACLECFPFGANGVYEF